EVARAVTTHLGVEAHGPLGNRFDLAVLQTSPVAFCQRHRAFALDVSGHHVVIAPSTPTDDEMLEQARLLFGKPDQATQCNPCTQYNPGRFNTAAFECTYCFAGDNCNAFDLEPDGSKPNGYSSACFVNPALFLRF
ncbi:MAG: hypothetical protein ACOYLV_17500, partial [Rubrivivax sp.]